MKRIKLAGQKSREELISDRLAYAIDAAEGALTAPTGQQSWTDADKRVHTINQSLSTVKASSDAAGETASAASQAAQAAAQVATQADETATAAKQAIDKLGNAFSTDADGAHVGAKSSLHTTVDAQGLHVMSGTEEIATFAKNTVALAKGATEAEISMVDSAFHLGVKRKNNPDIGVIQDAVFSGESFAFNPRYSYTTTSSVLKFAAIESNANRGIEVFIKPQGYEVAYIADKNVLSSATGTHKHLINLLTTTPWKDLGGVSGSDYVRYKQVGAEAYISVDVAGANNLTLTPKLPEGMRPENNMYLPAATYPGGRSALVWLGADGSVWITGAQSSTDRVVTTVPFPIKE